MVLNSIWSSDWDYILFRFWTENIYQKCLFILTTNQKLRINEKGAKVEKLICGEGNWIYPDLVPNPIYSFRPFKGKFTKEGISASAKIDHCYNNISILALGISSIPDPDILTHRPEDEDNNTFEMSKKQDRKIKRQE